MFNRIKLGSDDTKQDMINILSNKWPMTAKKMYGRLSKSRSISYQAVHKAMKELALQGVVEKNGGGYALSTEWINSINEFGQKLKNNYYALENHREIKKLYKFVFSRHMDFVRFHIDFTETVLEKEKHVSLLFLMRHVPYPFKFTGSDFEKLKALMSKVGQKIDWTIVARGSGPLDQWCAKYWRKFGIKVRTGTETPTDSSMFLVNDYIAETRMPQKANEFWDDLFRRTPDAVDIELVNEALFNAKFKTIVTIYKDKEMAEMLRSTCKKSATT